VDPKLKSTKDFETVRTLVNNFDPCGFIHLGAPIDEYDCLTNKILGHVYNKKNRQEIKDLILNEIEHHFGTPDLTILDEPYISDFYKSLDNLLDGLDKELKTNN
jgi:hypothetical protein